MRINLLKAYFVFFSHSFTSFFGDACTCYGSATMPKMWQNLSLGAYAAYSPGGQAHSLSWLSLRVVWNCGQVPELAALAYVASASRHFHKGFARAAHAQRL